jgi:hypothetical protein
MFVYLKPVIDDVLGMIDGVEAELYSEFTSAELQELADWALITIQRRTRKGKDYQGKRFAPYKQSTIVDRSKRRRKIRTVTLEDTGRMLTNMSSGVEGKRAVVFFSSANEGRKAYFLNSGTRHMSRRQFMRLSKTELAQANTMAAAMVIRRINSK